MSTYERNANRLTVSLFILLIGVSIASVVWLPGPLPIHFNVHGHPNRWGSPTTLLILSLVCGCMLGLLWVVVRHTPTEQMNFPGPHTPDNIARQRQNFDQLIATIRVIVTSLFLAIVGQSIWGSLHHSKQVIMWPSFLFIAAIFISMLVGMIKAYKLIPRQ